MCVDSNKNKRRKEKNNISKLWEIVVTQVEILTSKQMNIRNVRQARKKNREENASMAVDSRKKNPAKCIFDEKTERSGSTAVRYCSAVKSICDTIKRAKHMLLYRNDDDNVDV